MRLIREVDQWPILVLLVLSGDTGFRAGVILCDTEIETSVKMDAHRVAHQQIQQRVVGDVGRVHH
jgi:hypothetical protein